MKNKRKDYNWTNNRNYYNKLRKYYLEVDGDIRCSYCKYNKGENSNMIGYGGFEEDLKYPNWKMVSKNKKQWMKKPKSYKITETIVNKWRNPGTFYEIFW